MSSFFKNIKHPVLYLITDMKIFSSEKKFLCAICVAVKNGIDVIQLRENHLDTIKLFDLATKIKKITDTSKSKLIINDRIDIALAINADGVHLGWKSLPISTARKLLGKDKILGKSFHSIKEIKDNKDKDLDYVILSPIFPTPSKKGLIEPLGINTLKRAISVSNFPLIALGGINKNNFKNVIDTKVSGAGFIRAVLTAENISREINILKKIIM